MPRNRWLIFAGWLTLGLIWGSTWLFIKIGLSELPPFTYASLRFLVALVPLWLWCAVSGRKLPRSGRDWGLMAITGGLIITGNYGLVFWGGQFISSGQTATIHASLPLFAFVFAHIFIASEKLSLRRAIAVPIGFAGIAVIFAQDLQLSAGSQFIGSLAVLLAAAGFAFATVMVKTRGKHFDPVVLTTLQMTIGVLPLIGIALVTEDQSQLQFTPTAIGCLLYLGLVGSAFAFVLMFWLIRRMPVALTQLTPFVSTVVAVVLGVAVRGEPLTTHFIFGALAVLLSLFLTVERTPNRVKAA